MYIRFVKNVSFFSEVPINPIWPREGGGAFDSRANFE